MTDAHIPLRQLKRTVLPLIAITALAGALTGCDANDLASPLSTATKSATSETPKPPTDSDTDETPKTDNGEAETDEADADDAEEEAPEPEVNAYDEHFGTFDAFKAQLTTATQGVQGSGWGVLAWEPLGKRLIITQVYDHHGNVGIGGAPILVFDAWEHAYYLQYKNVRPDYVGKLWSLVNWEDVAARFAAAKG